MLAERRDFTVATYSSARGTGDRSTIWVFTGSACGGAALASVFVQPELRRITTPSREIRKKPATAFALIDFILIFILDTCEPYSGRPIPDTQEPWGRLAPKDAGRDYV